MLRHVAFAVFVSTAVTVPLPAAAVDTALTDNFGECLGSTIASLKRRAANVFEATVISIKPAKPPEFVATLDVHRVWKGNASSATTVYFRLSTAGPYLEDSKRYIFFAEPMTPAVRKAQGLAEDHPARAYWLPPCSGPITPEEAVVKQLGRSRKPQPK